jgi:diguanylate cyclase (GGDEF)-like protein/PAS domain S-box-containing protein
MTDQAEETRPLVLVVDDDFTMRLLVSQALEQSGFEVAEACDGEEGLNAFAERQPSAVLMDVMMPGMDGFTACAELRKRPESERVPVLMMTGLEDVASINQAYSAGATDFITKPINYTLLGHRVRYLLRASQAIAGLVESERRLASAQRAARLGYWDWSALTGTLSGSEQVYEILGVASGESLSTFDELLDRVHPEDRGTVQDWLSEARTNGLPRSVTHRVTRPDGRECHVRQQVEGVLEGGTVTHLYGTLQDITELTQAQQRIWKLAYFDGLTDLPNREFFRERVDYAVRVAKRHDRQLALLFIDLNHFKRINDTLGHGVGDQLLQATARRLRESLRVTDTVGRLDTDSETGDIARLGGDEFTILLSEIRRSEDARRVAERIFENLSQPLILSGHEVLVTPSVGIAVYPADGEDADTLLKNADMAMYYAKRSGTGHCQFFNPSMNDAALRRLTLETQLRRALERNELSLSYQPQVDTASGTLSGVEALLRWHSPLLGNISPVDFIPLAEETGLIVSIGEWVLRTACAQTREWHDTGIRMPRVAVNVSAQQFVQPGFADLVERILQETGVAPSTLELEVTESVLMKDADTAVATLTRLKAIGVQLAIDDFGTGYSSLAYLKQFPIDRLKIDKAFVKDITTDADDAAIATAVIAMASRMELGVVAEGVEEAAQVGFLKENLCDEIQGYFVSRPLPAREITEFLRQYAGAAGSSAEVVEELLAARSGTSG